MNRSSIRGAITLALAAVAMTGFPGVAHAGEPSAAEILKLADKAYGGFVDLTTESRLIVREPGQSSGREYRFVTISKGNEKRLVRFLEPGDVKGMGMLIEGRDTMYAFLPGFQRVRRLGTHVKNQTFMGSDASFDDMAATTWSGNYDAKLVGTEGNNWILEVTLLPGKDAEFPRRKLWIDKTVHQVTRLEDFDAKGVKLRTQTRTDLRKDQGNGEHYTPFHVTIVDHRRNDHTTEIIMLSAKVNQNVPDDVFTQRSLVRGQ